MTRPTLFCQVKANKYVIDTQFGSKISLLFIEHWLYKVPKWAMSGSKVPKHENPKSGSMYGIFDQRN